MVKLILDKRALKHGYVNLYTNDNVEIDESLSNEILLKTPCYDLAVSPKGELIELECDTGDLDRINPRLLSGSYNFEGKIVNFEGLINTIKNAVIKS
ncbi:MAG: hypothetical protein GXO45_03850 [Aquificae bacterium]|nr:hypothetical protein [Aquificota bacterium]